MRMSDRALAILGTTLVFIQVMATGWLCWVAGRFTNDGPQHLLTAFVHGHYHDSKLGWDETWYVNMPLTDHGYLEVFRALNAVFDWEVSHALAVWAPYAFGAAGWAALVLLLSGKRFLYVAAVCCSIPVGAVFWFGLLPFSYASSLIPWILVVFFRGKLTRKMDVFIFGSLFLVGVHCHPFPMIFIGVLLVVSLAYGGEWQWLMRCVLAGLPSAVMAILIWALGETGSGETTWSKIGDPLSLFFGNIAPGSFVVQVTLALFVVFIIWSSARRTESRGAPKGKESMVRAGLRGAALFCFLLAPLVPRHIPGWELVGPRFLPLTLPLFLALCVPPRVPTWKHIAGCFLAILFVGAHTLETSSRGRIAAEAYTEVYEDLRRVVPSLNHIDWGFMNTWGAFSAVETQTESYSGWVHMAQLLAVEKGGRPTFSQSGSRTLHGLAAPSRADAYPWLTKPRLGEYSDMWNAFVPDQRWVGLGGLLAQTRAPMPIVVVGFPTDPVVFDQLGYSTVALGTTTDHLPIFIAEPREGCSVDLELDSPFGDVVEIGIAPKNEPFDAFPVSAGRSHIRLEGYPCGRWWVRREAGCTGAMEGVGLADVTERLETLPCVRWPATPTGN